MEMLAEQFDPILNPTMYINSFELREPVTSLTDFLVAITAMYALYRYMTYQGERSQHYSTYLKYFLFIAIGMTSAAFLGHALQAYISPRWKTIGWLMSASGQLFLILASVNQLGYKWTYKRRHLFKTAVIVKYFVFVLLILIPATSRFEIVQINSSIDLVGIVLPLQFLFYRDTKIKGSFYVMMGILYAIIPGLIYSNQLSIDRWFNYHDISHVLMSIFIFIMFVGTFKIVTDPKHISLNNSQNK